MALMEFLLFHTKGAIFGVINSPPIADKDVGVVELCSFVYLTADSSGSAICISALSSVSLQLVNSVFRFCTASSEGGAIYYSSRSLSLHGCCFCSCFSLAISDNKYGNVIFSDTTDISLLLSAFFFCGPPTHRAGDSTQYVRVSGRCDVGHLNNTECSNRSGASGLLLDGSSTTKSVMSHVNIVSGTSRHIFANLGSFPIDALYFNIANVSILDNGTQFTSQLGTKFVSSHIYLTTDKYTNTETVTFQDCYGNLNSDGFIKSDNTMTAQFHVKNGDGCVLEREVANRKVHSLPKGLVFLSSLLFYIE